MVPNSTCTDVTVGGWFTSAGVGATGFVPAPPHATIPIMAAIAAPLDNLFMMNSL
jgi:hypothetical protein